MVYVLDHLGVEHSVELLAAGRQVLGRSQQVVQVQAASLRVETRDPDIFFRYVVTRDLGT